MPVELTSRYLRIRLEDPRKFKKFRTHDVGRKGHSKRLAGLSKRTGKWETQAWLLSRADLKKHDSRTWGMLLDLATKVKPQDSKKIHLSLRRLI